MANKGGFLGNLYYSITGEDNLKKILQEDKALAQEVAKIAGGIKIGKTRITQKDAEDILKVGNAYQGAAKGADQLAAARERALKKQSAGEFKEYIQSLTRYSDAQKQMSAYYSELEKEQGTAQTAAGSIKMLEAELKKLKDTYRSLSETDRNSGIGRSLLTTINNADENLAKINAEMANNAALAKTMGTQYNGLRTQIGMVARELPNFAISISTGIISLSNNLPMLADEISRVRQEVASLRKSGETFTPVYKQILSALVNWQTALIIGVTVLTAYSREIQAWIQGLISGEKNVSKLKESLSNFNQELIKGETNARLLFDALKRTNEGTEGRRKAINDINNEYGKYLPNLLTEKSSIDELDAAYRQITRSIKDSLAARLQSNAINDVAGESIKKQADALEEIRHIAEKKVKGKDDNYFVSMVDDIVDLTETFRKEGYGIEKTIRGVFDKIRYLTNNADLGKGFGDAVRQYVNNYYGYQEELIQIQKKYNPFFNKEEADKDVIKNKAYWEEIKKQADSALEHIDSKQRASLDKGVTKGIPKDIIESYTRASNALKEANEQLKVYESSKEKTSFVDTEKQRSEIEKANQILKEAVTKAELDIEQTRINLMKDGSEKTLAQIKLDYHKRNAAIEKESKDSLEKVRKLEREQWEKENPNFKKDKLQFTSIIDLTNQLKTLGNQMNETFGKGNVDLLARPLVDAAELAKKGWEDAGDGIATVFSSSFQLNQAGKDVMVHVTPILPDGTVLSPEELEQYIDTTLNDAENILQADNKKNGGLGIVLNVDTDLSDKIAEDFGEGLHLAQEKYYDLKEEIKKNPLSIQVENFQSQQNEQLKQSSDLQEKQTGDLLKSLLLKYQDFATRRKTVEKQFNNDIAILNAKRTDENGEEIDRSVKVANDKMKEALKSITEEENKALANQDNTFLKRLFGDVSEMGFSDLSKLIEQARLLRSYLSGNGDVNGIEFISPEQLKAIEESPAELDKLKKALEGLLSGGKSNSWDNIFERFTKGLAKLKSAKGFKEVSEGLQDIGSAASTASSMLGDVVGDLSSMFEEMGNTKAADAMSGVQDAMSAISNIGQGFAKGGIIGGIAAAVGEAANFIGKAFAAEARHQAALKEIMNETISQQREYNLLLLQQNIEYEKAKTIFGTDAYGKAANAVNVLEEAMSGLNNELLGTVEQQKSQSKDAFFKKVFGIADPQAELKKAYAGLADIEVKTGHKKTGIFGWGKGKDIYSSILDVYPDLIDGAGKFNKELAETIINTREMSEEDKAALQNLIDLSQTAEDALQEMNDYLTGIFGDFGGTLSDALVDAFSNGSDAAKLFTKSVSDMLENLATQMAYSLFIGPELEKAQKEISDIMLNTALSDAEKFEKAGEVVDKATDNIMKDQDKYNAWLQDRKDEAKDKGYDIFEPDNNKQSGLTGAAKNITEDQADIIGSYLNAMRADLSAQRVDVHTLTNIINADLPIISAMAEAQLIQLNNIANNTLAIAGYTGKNADNTDRILDILDGARRSKEFGLWIK